MPTQKNTRTLLAFTGWIVFGASLSYVCTKRWIPALFPYWGILLLVLLIGWSTLSILILLWHRSRWAIGLVAMVLIAASLVAVTVSWSGLAAILLIGCAIGVLGIITLCSGLLYVFQKPPAGQWLLLGLVPLLGGTVTLAVVNLTKPVSPALLTHAQTVEEELRYMFATDQADRTTGRFILDASRDADRLQRTLILDQQGFIRTPEAQYHAALLLQHGTCPEQFRRAYELAVAAAQANIPTAEALSRASYDRWMLALGQPQKYGTQWLISQASTCKTSR